ncbi:hypothetical protein [Streptomyces sp. NPDC046909]|uniref:hypothetical protein n=1 Tax=Streptomyces sp. NPDC046909 TaxID=3155617 RepID=UPI0033F0D88A
MWTDGHLGDQRRDHVRVAAQHLVETRIHRGQDVLPRRIGLEVRQFDLAEDAVDDVGDDLGLALEVPIQRRRSRVATM